MSEKTDRTEQAFRDAFAQRAEAYEPGDLDLPGPTADDDDKVLPLARRGHRVWRVLVAAGVVVVALAAAVTGARLIMPGNPDAAVENRSGPAGGRPSTLAEGEAESGPQADRASIGDLPPPDEGWRWVSWRNVAVQVPSSWPYDHAPKPDWCAERDAAASAESGPFVAADPSFAPVLLIRCRQDPAEDFDSGFSDGPDQQWRPHVVFGEPTTADGEKKHRSWTLTALTVEEVQVKILASPETQKFTGRIIDSARTFEIDQNGCPATSAVQARRFGGPEVFDVGQVDAVGALSICRYRRIGTDRPALSASRLVEGAEADDLLAAIQAAPVGGGPDRPGRCIEDPVEAVTVRLHTATGANELYVYYDGCEGNGVTDGTNRRELTRESCGPLFATLPMYLFAGDGEVMEVCGP